MWGRMYLIAVGVHAVVGLSNVDHRAVIVVADSLQLLAGANDWQLLGDINRPWAEALVAHGRAMCA